MTGDPHTDFIAAAYGVATIVIVAMVVTILRDNRRLRRALARFGDEANRE